MEVGRYQKDLKFNSNKVKKRKLKQKFDIKKKKKTTKEPGGLTEDFDDNYN